jgi:hypothetical protein
MAQEFTFFHSKVRPFGVLRQTKPMAFLKHLLEMYQMIFIRFRKNGQIIKIDNHKFVPFADERDIHSALESSTYIHKTKRHLVIHKCTPRGGEGCFFFIMLIDSNLIVPRKFVDHRNPIFPNYFF